MKYLIIWEIKFLIFTLIFLNFLIVLFVHVIKHTYYAYGKHILWNNILSALTDTYTPEFEVLLYFLLNLLTLNKPLGSKRPQRRERS